MPHPAVDASSIHEIGLNLRRLEALRLNVYAHGDDGEMRALALARPSAATSVGAYYLIYIDVSRSLSSSREISARIILLRRAICLAIMALMKPLSRCWHDVRIPSSLRLLKWR